MSVVSGVHLPHHRPFETVVDSAQQPRDTGSILNPGYHIQFHQVSPDTHLPTDPEEKMENLVILVPTARSGFEPGPVNLWLGAPTTAPRRHNVKEKKYVCLCSVLKGMRYSFCFFSKLYQNNITIIINTTNNIFPWIKTYRSTLLFVDNI